MLLGFKKKLGLKNFRVKGFLGSKDFRAEKNRRLKQRISKKTLRGAHLAQATKI